MERFENPNLSYENFEIVKFFPGETFFVSHICNSDPVCAECEEEGNSTKLIFKKSTLAVIESLHESGRGSKHLRFMRMFRPGYRFSFGDYKKWPKMRAALNHIKAKTTYVPGGLCNCIIYSDEILIPNFSMSGTTGWIITRKDIMNILSSLPPLKDSGNIKSIWIRFTGCSDIPDESDIEIYDEDPTNNELLSTYFSNAHGFNVPLNEKLFRVDFDLGSRKVKKIICNNTEVSSVIWQTQPSLRALNLGG